MPNGATIKRPAGASIYDSVRQAALNKLQQPQDDNWLKAVLLGGLGGVLETLTPTGDEMMQESVMNATAPMAMVRMPKEAILGYAKNFRNRVPQQLADEGQLPLAEEFDQLAKQYPEWFGQLSDVQVNPNLDSVGSYTSNVIHDDIASLLSYGQNHGRRVKAGLTAPSNNRIEINPKYIRENVDLKAIVPNISDSSQSVTPMFAKHVTRHEAKHLGQDVAGQLDPKGTTGPHYWVHPDEVEARIFEKAHPLNMDSIMLELANGKQRTMTQLLGQPIAERRAQKTELAKTLEHSLNVLLQRMRPEDHTIKEAPQTLLNFLLRDLR